ncbi:hypothetical protein DRE_03429 [Drechslerella stenobrocha 248]|uniref:Sulfatase N-terminal domain-containing protein n=1 Tax=Drechslerella stenobrocha 248 TaxID=1043628 RepID=W7IE59_9PEZI|nr:hypothetical protein DRE_03429 [Drechslerella stenobrocha 248]
MPTVRLKDILLYVGVATAISWGGGDANFPDPLVQSPNSGWHSEGFGSRKPNIVFIITDDQDIEMSSLDYMPFVKEHLLDKGGYPKFVSQGFNENWLPVWLQQAGYNTYYTGKLFNFHTVRNYNSPHVKGFTGSDFLLDPFTYNYLSPAFQRDHNPPVIYPGNHTMDITADKAYALLDDALASGNPFFIGVAPVAPHSNVEVDTANPDRPNPRFSAPIPLNRHSHLFPTARVPRTPHFNPEKPSGVSWIAQRPRLNKKLVDHNDHHYRQRLRALQGVDELVDGLFKRLRASGQLDNTYVFYTSDNGFHIGQHRLNPGKECGFEEDIRVPLIVRGPGVAVRDVSKAITTHIDLAPTIFKIAGIPPREDFDGLAIPLRKAAAGSSSSKRHEHVNVEYWGFALEESKLSSEVFLNNTYKSLRIIGPNYNLYYSVWCNNEHQLYDLTTDPYQLRNLYPGYRDYSKTHKILEVPLVTVIGRLDSLLLVLKSCKGSVCVKPWAKLHPDGDVDSLLDSLKPRFDAFYDRQQSVQFDRCEMGYILDAEGPQEALSYTRGIHWSHWV